MSDYLEQAKAERAAEIAAARAHELARDERFEQARQAADLLKAYDERMDKCMREQTAAFILAALIQAPDNVYRIPPEFTSDEGMCRLAVLHADLLRAELAKVKP